MESRAARLARLRAERFDLLVIGGGIVGAALARDASARGLRTALVEKRDFASGTSGKTSRLVHGGLRYLWDGRIGLVRMALRERDRLLKSAPALVRPLRFTIPAYASRPPGPWSLRIGLFLYDLLAHSRTLPPRRRLRVAEVLEAEPRLRREGLLGAWVYHDAVTDDSRLVLAMIRSAVDFGAVVANAAEVTGLVREAGRVMRATVRDRSGDASFEIQASVIVNATGVWLDRLRASRARSIRPTKGIHVLVPRNRIGHRDAVVLGTGKDDRIVFVIPWGDLSLVGTTDTDYDGDRDRVVPTSDDVGYLLATVNEAFPDAHLAPHDVVSAFAGLRPLVRGRSVESRASDVSRAHDVHEDPDGLISVAGGKLTTARAIAEDVVDRVMRRLGRDARATTETAALGPSANAKERYRTMGFDDATAVHLASRYMPESVVRWRSAEPMPDQRIVSDLPYLWVEVAIAVEEEMALTVADVLVRRLGIFYEARDQGLSVAQAVAERMAARLGWDAGRTEREVAAYGELVREHRRFRADSHSGGE